MILGLSAGVVWFFIFIIGQIATCHWAEPAIRPRITQMLLFIGMTSFPLGILILQFVSLGVGLIGESWFMCVLWFELTLVALFILYMPFYYTVAASLSVRTIILLAARSSGAMPMLELREQFVSRKLVAQRLETMKENRLLMQDFGGYILSSKGRFIAEAFLAIKRLWRLGPGG